MDKKLLKRFYRGECSADEKRMLHAYFKEHPDELEAYFSESEWADLDASQQLDLDITERMRSVIREGIHPKKNSYQIFRTLAIAASLLLLVGLGWQFFMHTKDVLKQGPERMVRIPVNKINKTDSIIKLELPDGSLVELFPKSELHYLVPFDSTSRKVVLSGIAKFDVFHDSTRPFSVISEEIATTALGTSFRVIAVKGMEDVSVQLYAGSVVIRNAELHQTTLSMDYYLVPGEVFFYNRSKKISGISTREKAFDLASKKSVKKKEGSDLSTARNNWYMFNNQSLAMVFESLETIYDVRIKYNPRDIHDISFIGKVEQGESIENLLADIAKLNNLRVTKNGKSFSITKK